jgi:hypothetical protein
MMVQLACDRIGEAKLVVRKPRSGFETRLHANKFKLRVKSNDPFFFFFFFFFYVRGYFFFPGFLSNFFFYLTYWAVFIFLHNPSIQSTDNRQLY